MTWSMLISTDWRTTVDWDGPAQLDISSGQLPQLHSDLTKPHCTPNTVQLRTLRVRSRRSYTASMRRWSARRAAMMASSSAVNARRSSSMNKSFDLPATQDADDVKATGSISWVAIGAVGHAREVPDTNGGLLSKQGAQWGHHE